MTFLCSYYLGLKGAKKKRRRPIIRSQHVFSSPMMVKLHHFGITVKEYYHRGKENIFPDLYGCPHPCCSFEGRLRRHGFYTRNALTLLATYLIVIQRYYCPSCKKTVSLLPSFLAPRFQYSLSCIFFALYQLSVRRIQLHRIAEVINDRAHRQELSHQQLSFYRKRICDNQPLITAFLGQQGLFLADLEPGSCGTCQTF
jgi:transposase-like protein